MGKKRTAYVCQQCGAQFPAWSGRCTSCGEWNSLAEETVEATPKRRSRTRSQATTAKPLTEIPLFDQARIGTGSPELDRVLGGGLVPGSTILIGGEPGIGKSTLLLQASCGMATQGAACLYVTGEESAEQIRLRAERVGASHGKVLVLAETDIDAVLASAEERQPDVMVVDSIQAVFDPELQSAPGTVSQVRQCAAKLIQAGKTTGFPVFLVGHVTKQGTLAGPRTLEHMVDTVLYFEGDRYHSYRVLRAAKNRFGSTDELAVFTMSDRGLEDVDNPSALFLQGREEARPGCTVAACVEGTRVLLVEVQALLSPSPYAAPRRQVTGADPRRVTMLAAVLDQRCRLKVAANDIFVNVVGGVKVEEPGIDLAICAAMASALKGKPVPTEMVIFGEVGLTGEVRPVRQVEQRLNEAERLGFTSAMIPLDGRKGKGRSGLELSRVRMLGQALEMLL